MRRTSLTIPMQMPAKRTRARRAPMRKRNKRKIPTICGAVLLFIVAGFSTGTQGDEPGSTPPPNDTEQNGGYDMRAPEGGTFLGRYRLSRAALVDAGWKNLNDRWTEKASRRQPIVTDDDDFLDSPDAQEQALTDLLQRTHSQLKHDGSIGHVPRSVADSQGQNITVTASGLMAAALRVGSITVRKYLDPDGRKFLRQDQIEFIESRLRDFASTPYDPAANAREADTGKTGRDAKAK